MMSLIARYGRKFTLALIAMALGFTITVLGLLILISQPSVGMHVAEIVGQFGLVLSVSIGAFSGANAVVEWKHGTAASSSSTVTETVTKVAGTPPARPSGTVADPGNERVTDG